MRLRATALDQQLPSYYREPSGLSIPPILELYTLRSRQWQPAEAIQESQRKKLVKTISRAYAQVRYYKELFDNAGVATRDINDAEDLDVLPITERQAFQSIPLRDIIASNVNVERCVRRRTAGSTSQPLMVYRNRKEDNLYDMSWAFAFLEDGQRFFDRCADFHFNPEMYRRGRWLERIGIWRRTTISAFAEPIEQLSMLKTVRPNVIRGNPADLLKLISTIQRNKNHEIKPRLVFTMGSLLEDQFRLLIESVLGAEVFDFYGSAELGCIAWECSEHNGYHINSESVILEIVDALGHPVPPGERGRIVCTGLIANTMPFIRYYTGDIGVLDDRPCSCGRGLPLLSRLEGKANDFFILRDGSEIAPTIILQYVKRIQGIRQFKIVQEDITQILVEVVPDWNWTAESLDTLRNILELITHHCATIKIALVGEIPQEPSRKFQSVVSKVERKY